MSSFISRCPTYGSIPASCHLETDPNEPCCKAPVCSYDPFTGQTFVPIPQFQPAVTGSGQVRPPSTGELLNHQISGGSVTLYPTGFTPQPPTAATGVSGGIGKLTCSWKIGLKDREFFIVGILRKKQFFVILRKSLKIVGFVFLDTQIDNWVGR